MSISPNFQKLFWSFMVFPNLIFPSVQGNFPRLTEKYQTPPQAYPDSLRLLEKMTHAKFKTYIVKITFIYSRTVEELLLFCGWKKYKVRYVFYDTFISVITRIL